MRGASFRPVSSHRSSPTPASRCRARTSRPPTWRPEDTEIAEAVGAGAEWMTELLARLVDRDTTLGNEEAGQAVMREALLELGLEPVDVRMDPEALRAHPAASPFDWDVRDKSNVVATWAPDPSQRRAQPDPERPHRCREPRAEVAVGSRPLHGPRRGRLALRSGCGRHEMWAWPRSSGRSRGCASSD